MMKIILGRLLILRVSIKTARTTMEEVRNIQLYFATEYFPQITQMDTDRCGAGFDEINISGAEQTGRMPVPLSNDWKICVHLRDLRINTFQGLETGFRLRRR